MESDTINVEIDTITLDDDTINRLAETMDHDANERVNEGISAKLDNTRHRGG